LSFKLAAPLFCPLEPGPKDDVFGAGIVQVFVKLPDRAHHSHVFQRALRYITASDESDVSVMLKQLLKTVSVVSHTQISAQLRRERGQLFENGISTLRRDLFCHMLRAKPARKRIIGTGTQ
jgi:hypothetical protein